MDTLSWILAALFLPLFPLGMVFNLLFQRVRAVWLRTLLLLLWPLPGVWILHAVPPELSGGLLLWALASALLYGFRAVVVRELYVWTGFLATSAWSLAWIALAAGSGLDQLILQVLAFSLPLALLTNLAAALERRYESAFAGIVRGVAQAQPRLAGMLVITLLAVIGSPLFPAFFSMLGNVTGTVGSMPVVAIGVATVWFLWSWSGARLLQELLVGPAHLTAQDLSRGATTTCAALLLLLVAAGLYLSGVLL